MQILWFLENWGDYYNVISIIFPHHNDNYHDNNIVSYNGHMSEFILVDFFIVKTNMRLNRCHGS